LPLVRHLGRFLCYLVNVQGKVKGRTLFQQNSFQKRVLVSQHQAFLQGLPIALSQVGEVVLMALYGGLELLDVFRSTLSKGRLRLPIPLLTFL
jgi:hypothetical protein